MLAGFITAIAAGFTYAVPHAMSAAHARFGHFLVINDIATIRADDLLHRNTDLPVIVLVDLFIAEARGIKDFIRDGIGVLAGSAALFAAVSFVVEIVVTLGRIDRAAIHALAIDEVMLKLHLAIVVFFLSALPAAVRADLHLTNLTLESMLAGIDLGIGADAHAGFGFKFATMSAGKMHAAARAISAELIIDGLVAVGNLFLHILLHQFGIKIVLAAIFTLVISV